MDKKQVTTVSVAGLGSAVALFALMDTRYAIATDVELIIQAIQGDRVERIEMQIKESEEPVRGKGVAIRSSVLTTFSPAAS